MVDRVQGLVFEVEVDSASAEKNLKRFGATARSEVASVGKAAKSSGGQIDGLSDSTKVLGGESSTAAQQIDEMKQQFAGLRKRADNLIPSLRNSARGLASVRAAALKLAAAALVVTFLFKMTKAFFKLGFEVTKNTEAYRGFSSSLDESKNLLGNIVADLVGMEQAFERMNERLEALNPSLEEFARRVQFAREAIDKSRFRDVAGVGPLGFLRAGLLVSAFFQTPEDFELDRRLPGGGTPGGRFLPGLGGRDRDLSGLQTTLGTPEAYVDAMQSVLDIAPVVTTEINRWTDAILKSNTEAALLVDTLGGLDDDINAQVDKQLEILAKIEEIRQSALGLMEPFNEFLNRAPEIEAASEPLITMADRLEIVRVALQATANSLLFMAQTGKFSFRSLVNSVAQAVFGILAALAIENTVLGFTETARAAAAAARYDFVAAAKHGIAAGLHFKAAALAGALGAAALGVVAATRDSGGGGGGGGVSRAGPAPATDLGEPAGQRQEITIIIEGQGFIQDKETFAREIARSIQRETRAAGA